MSSDLEAGLLWALRLDGRGGASPVKWSQASHWNTSEGLLWLHMDRSRKAVQAWIREHVSERVGLHPGIDDALLAEETRPRCELLGGKLVLVLRGVNLNAGAEPEDMVSLRLFFDGSRIISLRYDRVIAPQELARELEECQGPTDSGSFLVRLLDRNLDRIGTLVEELADCLYDLEDAVLTGKERDLRRRLAGLRRRIVAVRRHLAPQREALVRLAGLQVDWIGHEHMADVRQVADRLTRYLEDLEEVRERASVTHDELASGAQEQLNRRMVLLSTVAAIFLPLSLVTGLLGINVGGIPFAQHEFGFFAVCGVLGLLAALELFLLRRMRWP